ncbi:MAG TPA: ester cyclase [Bryobacteraceae bacterium]|nr:ester cyclase [Bryobacteraceae bacterium]
MRRARNLSWSITTPSYASRMRRRYANSWRPISSTTKCLRAHRAVPRETIQLRATLHKAFPGLKIEIEDIVAEADRVAVRARWTGTHRGPLPMLPFPPANRSFEISGMVFWRIREGKIAERWAILDRAGLMQQLAPKS